MSCSGNVTETGGAAAVFDLGEAQQGGDDRQRLIDSGHCLVRNLLELLQRGRMRSAALQRKACARQRRPQIMGDIVADTRQAR